MAIQAGGDHKGFDIIKEPQTWMAAIDLIRTADSQGRRKVLMLEPKPWTAGMSKW